MAINTTPPVIADCSYLGEGDKCTLAPFEGGVSCCIYICMRLHMSVKIAICRGETEGLDD
jgi:hypothetical protein